jgi:hypothetical protein
MDKNETLGRIRERFLFSLHFLSISSKKEKECVCVYIMLEYKYILFLLSIRTREREKDRKSALANRSIHLCLISKRIAMYRA